MELKKRKRRIKFENAMGINDDVFISIGLGSKSFTLYGEEARTHVAKERAEGRLLNPCNDGSSGFHVYLSDDLEDGLIC